MTEYAYFGNLYAYPMPDMKRTSVILDRDLVREAAEVLGTTKTTETLHSAMRAVVRQERLRRLAAHDFPGLTLDAIKEMRRSRTETREWGKWLDESR